MEVKKLQYRKINVGDTFQFVNAIQMEVLHAKFDIIKYLKAVFTKFSFKIVNGFNFYFKSQTFGRILIPSYKNPIYIKLAIKEGMPYNLVIGEVSKQGNKFMVTKIFRCRKPNTNVYTIHGAKFDIACQVVPVKVFGKIEESYHG